MAVDLNAFQTPPKAVRPETWFHFIGGNVAEKGIVADLDAIQAAGISGIQFFHGQFGGPWPGVAPQIKCLSEPWDGLVGRLADECRARGLSFKMQNCPGWAMSGGPWIKPENAMRKLAYSRTDVKGGAKVMLKLPVAAGSAGADRDYRDIAVIAFPRPADDTGATLKPQSITSNLKEYDLAAWQKGKALSLNIDSPERSRFEYHFDQPVTLRTVEFPPINDLLHYSCYVPECDITVEAITPEGVRTIAKLPLPQGNWQEESYRFSIACDEATAKTFRVSVFNRHEIKLPFIQLRGAARQDNWEGEAGWTLRSQPNRRAPKQDASAWVPQGKILNLTDKLAKDGSFAWDAPAGDWIVLRVGHVNTMRRNGPAPKEGTGFECDKLSERGADVHYAGYIGRLANGPVKGKLDGMLMDSWECCRQTWTIGFDADFAKRCGYDLFGYMPALFGWVVDNPDTTRRFLRDWRGLISHSIANRFYGRMAELGHRNGLHVQFETAFGDVVPGDVMEYYKHADTPMCEFWQPRQWNGVGSHNFKPVRPTVSAANLYGKNRVAAEALTSFALTWNEKLRDLKQVANLHMAMGVTHMVFHTYTHNPRTDWLPPGTSFGARIGTPFLRGQTWWKHMPEFTDYLARCGYMLEAGKPVKDVLWYLGDMLDHKPLEDAEFPDGFAYDYCNPDALLTRVSVKNGLWSTPEGVAYKVLWVPECRWMLPETLEKILAGVRAGGKVVFAALPEATATLKDGANAAVRVRAATEQLRQGGSNCLVEAKLEAALERLQLVADVEQHGRNRVWWNHRADAESDWYFVTADNAGGFDGSVDFRQTGKVEIYDPATGKMRGPSGCTMANGRTTLELRLAPSEALFVVFRHHSPARTAGSVTKDGVSVVPAMGANDAKNFMVYSAFYGAQDDKGNWVQGKHISVHSELQSALNHRERTFRVANSTFGIDPAWRTVKRFRAELRSVDGRVIKLESGENANVVLPYQPAELGACTVEGDQVTAWQDGEWQVTCNGSMGAKQPVKDTGAMKLAEGWTVKFAEGWGMPAAMSVDALKPWKELGTTPEAKSYSGTATYVRKVTLATMPERAVLDLGRVESLARVRVNGVDLGALWCEPYRVDVTKALKAGENVIEIDVTDTWFNRLVYDAGQPEAKRRTWTIAGPSAKAGLVESGLLGPVQLHLGQLLK